MLRIIWVMEKDAAFRFGQWTVDPSRNVLLRAGKETRLQPRVMLLLVRLAQSNGKVVSRDELFADVWSGRVVGDEALFRVVSELRTALGDDGKSARVIETIRGRGYRLAVQVREDVPARRFLPIAAVILLTTIAAMLIWTGRGDDEVLATDQATTARPLTTYPEREIDPAISPDGRRIVFAWNKTGDYELYLREIETGDIRRITTRSGFEGHPVWSPRGDRIAYVAANEDGEFLRIAGLSDSPHRSVAVLQSWSFGLDWSADGNTLALSQPGELTRMRIFFFDIASGELSPAPWTNRGEQEYRPVFSPEGDRVAFLRGSVDGFAQVFVADLSDGSLRPVTVAPMLIRGLDWEPAGDRLVFSASVGSDFELWTVSLDDSKDLRRVPGIQGQPYNPVLSDDGRLVYEQVAIDVDIVAYDVESSTERVIVRSTKQDRQPDLSPDETELVFVSDRSGFPELYSVSLGDNQIEQLTFLDGSVVAQPHYSPDGEKISFLAQRDGGFTVGLLDMTSGVTRYIGSDEQYAVPIDWIDDSLLSVAVHIGSAWETVVFNLDGEQVQPVGNDIVLTASGASIATFRPSDGMLLNISLNAEVGPVVPYAWTTGNGNIYFFASDRMSINTFKGDIVAPFAALDSAMAEQFAVSADGRYIYYGRIETSSSDLYLQESAR